MMKENCWSLPLEWQEWIESSAQSGRVGLKERDIPSNWREERILCMGPAAGR